LFISDDRRAIITGILLPIEMTADGGRVWSRRLQCSIEGLGIFLASLNVQLTKECVMRAAIVGFGRIGRAIFRINDKRGLFDIVAINDINPDNQNMAYLLQYDSEYGRFEKAVTADDSNLYVNGSPTALFHENRIHDIPWESLDVDVVIDSSGVHDNVSGAPCLIERGVKKVIITHSPDEVDHTLILGANEETYNPAEHHVISSSICDAVAVAPVIKMIDEAFGIESGFLTTLHPWLSYQNLLDGPSFSWSSPGEIYCHYAVGRGSTRGLIPKPTSAVEATLKVLPKFRGAFRCMSFRVPTPVVGAANIYLRLKGDASVEEVHRAFERYSSLQKWPIIRRTKEPLVSVDFLGCEYSSTVDERWTDLAGDRHLYLVLWYDNEWGYSNHALSVADYVLRERTVGSPEVETSELEAGLVSSFFS
jgi:glyceraldehyde 3-phosphate dehydrogenase